MCLGAATRLLVMQLGDRGLSTRTPPTLQGDIGLRPHLRIQRRPPATMLATSPPKTAGIGATHGSQPLSYAASPTSVRSQTFKRPASSDDDDVDDGAAGGRGHGSRRNAVVKRACNECRQQKVRLSSRVDGVQTGLTLGSSSAMCSRTLL